MNVLRRMTELDYVAWMADTIPAYAADKVQSGQWPEEESLALSEREFAELLPAGLQTPDNHLYTVVDSELRSVGVLWFAVQVKYGERVAYVYDVAIAPERQREGHAYRAFRELESEVRRIGLSGIALHVFGHNKSARRLYDKLGFEAKNINLYKAVSATGA